MLIRVSFPFNKVFQERLLDLGFVFGCFARGDMTHAMGKNAIHMKIFFTIDNDGKWRRLDGAIASISFKQRDVENVVDAEGGREIKAISHGTNSLRNWKRPDPLGHEFGCTRKLHAQIL